MKFPRIYTLKELASLISAEYQGDGDFPVCGMNEIHRVEEGEVIFVDNSKYYDKALNSLASVVIINSKEIANSKNKKLIFSEDPYRDFNNIAKYFKISEPHKEMHSPSAKIGKNTIIEPNVFIGKEVEIGDNCVIFPNVVIHDYTKIGNNVVIQSGTVVGGEAFYYKKREDHFERLYSVGNVIIGDYVEIGSNCTIDRGVTAATIIGDHCKLDNLIQIGHDAVLGKRCIIASQVGIAGCCIFEDDVSVWGQAGFSSSLLIGKGAVILAQSGVSKNLEGGKVYFGYPAEESRKVLKELAYLKRIAKGNE